MNSAWDKASFEKNAVRFCVNEEGLKQREAETLTDGRALGVPPSSHYPRFPVLLSQGMLGFWLGTSYTPLLVSILGAQSLPPSHAL